ncbi:MAG: hypothetical protein WCF19_05980 [Chlamydiales bacterium]
MAAVSNGWDTGAKIAAQPQNLQESKTPMIASTPHQCPPRRGSPSNTPQMSREQRRESLKQKWEQRIFYANEHIKAVQKRACKVPHPSDPSYQAKLSAHLDETDKALLQLQVEQARLWTCLQPRPQNDQIFRQAELFITGKKGSITELRIPPTFYKEQCNLDKIETLPKDELDRIIADYSQRLQTSDITYEVTKENLWFADLLLQTIHNLNALTFRLRELAGKYESLDLSGLDLYFLPETIVRNQDFSITKDLNLDGNQLQQIPFLSSMDDLETLSIRNNKCHFFFVDKILSGNIRQGGAKPLKIKTDSQNFVPKRCDTSCLPISPREGDFIFNNKSPFFFINKI